MKRKKRVVPREVCVISLENINTVIAIATIGVIISAGLIKTKIKLHTTPTIKPALIALFLPVSRHLMPSSKY